MIATLRGVFAERTEDGIVLDVNGLGYAVSISGDTALRLPASGGEVFLHVVESVAMYGGGVTLYGFLSAEEKSVFLALKENVPGAGAKKALELLDKAAKSLPDFRRAIMDKDAKGLVTAFGFTAKTAEKIVSGLQNKVAALPVPAGAPRLRSAASAVLDEAVQGLLALGYKDAAARDAAQSAREALGPAATTQALLREALRHLAGRVQR